MLPTSRVGLAVARLLPALGRGFEKPGDSDSDDDASQYEGRRVTARHISDVGDQFINAPVLQTCREILDACGELGSVIGKRVEITLF